MLGSWPGLKGAVRTELWKPAMIPWGYRDLMRLGSAWLAAAARGSEALTMPWD